MNKDGLTIDEYGTKRWYLNGKFHRTDGPGCEYHNGNKYWYVNDKLHRTDGPAIEYHNGNKYWFLNGISLSHEEYLKTNRKNKLELLIL